MAVEYKDYYRTLGVERDASEADIKKAFRKLARLYHPDTAKDKRTAEEKFKEINEAYEVLGDAAKRKRYDELGSRWQTGSGEMPHADGVPRGQWRTAGPEDYEFSFGGTGFSDFFEQFFGGGARGAPDAEDLRGFGFDAPRATGARGVPHGRADRPTPRAGADIEGDILVTLEEALHGAVREVTVSLTDPATGDVTARKTYRARIPRGVRDGQAIRLAGAGQPGAAGGPAGDLYLRARFARHPDYRVQDADLYYDLDLAPWEAVLGTTVTVRTLDTRVSLRIPPGTTPGRTFRVRGHGLPTGTGDARGELYIVARIQTPTETTAEERELWAKLAQTSHFNPREPR